MKKQSHSIPSPKHYTDLKTKTTTKVVGKHTYVYPAGQDMPVAIITNNKILLTH